VDELAQLLAHLSLARPSSRLPHPPL
jgi:hypothetical protein